MSLEIAARELVRSRRNDEEAVIRGGDTDTNGALAGAVLGACRGLEALPRRWLEAMLSYRPERRPRVRRSRPTGVLAGRHSESWPSRS